MYRYCVWDGEDGEMIETCLSLQDARKLADEVLEEYRDQARGDEWPDVDIRIYMEIAVSVEVEVDGHVDFEIRETLQGEPQINKPIAPYGACPVCGYPGAKREDGIDHCPSGHQYPSRDAIPW